MSGLPRWLNPPKGWTLNTYEFFKGELTLARRLELVEKHRQEYGLNRCLRALSVSKSTWHRHRRPKVKREDEELKAKVFHVVEEHPAYGYRRIKAELAAAWGVRVNHKRLRRLLLEWDLGLRRQVARPRPSGVRRILKEAEGKLNLVRGREFEPFQVLCTDFTEIRYAGGTRKAQTDGGDQSRERLGGGLGGWEKR